MKVNFSGKFEKYIHSEYRNLAFKIVGIVTFGWLIYYRVWIYNPLPSDERMIKHFQTHRADFEEAVRRYREYPIMPGKDTGFWYMEGDTLEIYKRAGIDDIDYSIPMWLPDPYSIETAVRTERIVKELGMEAFRKFSALEITPATTPRINHPNITDHSSYRKFSFRFGEIWKSYYFTPEVPQVKNGEMLWPPQIVGKGFSGAIFHKREGVATSQTTSPVLFTLDSFPNDWINQGCVYRQIEPKWFLQMCLGRIGIS